MSSNAQRSVLHSKGLLPVALALVILPAECARVHAGSTPYQECDRARYRASAVYAACQQKALAGFFGKHASVTSERALAFSNAFQAELSKCHVTYSNKWGKLAKQGAPGQPTSCDGPRFTDNGDGTVTDELTGLQWERKTDDGTVHDKDNHYTWGLDLFGAGEAEASDGTLFTEFLATLNQKDACFAGRCDWRIPTLEELQTIVPPSVCTTAPCIEESVFGPTGAGGGPSDFTLSYWSNTSQIDLLQDAWTVYFGPPADVVFNAAPGTNYVGARPKTSQANARAVRSVW
jgi:hypothetical protein